MYLPQHTTASQTVLNDSMLFPSCREDAAHGRSLRESSGAAGSTTSDLLRLWNQCSGQLRTGSVLVEQRAVVELPATAGIVIHWG